MAARREQVRPTLDTERGILLERGGEGEFLLAGMDEVGRGALAGPVSVGVAVLSREVIESPLPFPEGLADSKLITAAVRESLCDPVRAWVSAGAVGNAAPGEIDELGIVGALRLAGTRALAQVRAQGLDPHLVLLDGTHDWLTDPLDLGLLQTTAQVPVRTVRKGDATCASIAAASVLAKVERDALMAALPDPGYGFAGHKGYGSASHLRALEERGPSDQHRRSWKLPPRRTTPTEGMMDL